MSAHMTTRRVSFAYGLLLLTIGSLEKKVSSVITAVSAMHDPTYNDTFPLIAVINASAKGKPYPQVKLSDVIKAKIENRQRFYGIEISARSSGVLDYGIFKVEPLFTSVIWVGGVYANMKPIFETPAIKCANILKQSGLVLPHITCYNMTEEKLDEFPLNDFKNVLVLRGDYVDEKQMYKHAVELVREIRSRQKDDICIIVGGYPEVHPAAESKEQDLMYLKQKVDSGADLIITQICFSANLIINFIKDCRKIGIDVPIIPGIYIPKNFRILRMMCNITEVCPPEEQMKEYERLQHDQVGFEDYALENTRTLIDQLFKSDVGIYGVQFFTLNNFDNVKKIIDEFFTENFDGNN